MALSTFSVPLQLYEQDSQNQSEWCAASSHTTPEASGAPGSLSELLIRDKAQPGCRTAVDRNIYDKGGGNYGMEDTGTDRTVTAGYRDGDEALGTWEAEFPSIIAVHI